MKLLLACALAAAAGAQDFTQRGFLETGAVVYPQAAPNDGGRLVGGALLRYEAFYKAAPWLRFSAGIDARADSHREAEREWGLSWWDRNRQRPAFAWRRLSAAYTRGKLSVEAGKQFVRWGKADILNPTDRFAPRDFLDVVANEFLAITAVRATYGTQADTIDLVWSPRLTPSRIPLLNQRWAVLPPGVPVVEAASRYPGGQQAGARWNHIGSAAEFSLSFYNGYNPLPLLQPSIRLAPARVELATSYPGLRMYGGDAAVPLKWVTVKGEAAWLQSRSRTADDYVLYVVQVERQAGEWFFVGGYAGQKVTARRFGLDFSPERGFTRAVVARAGYTIDTNRSVSLESVARQDGKGVWVRLEYTQAFGQHWRATAGWALVRGEEGDFLGQYRRNSHGVFKLRYSF